MFLRRAYVGAILLLLSCCSMVRFQKSQSSLLAFNRQPEQVVEQAVYNEHEHEHDEHRRVLGNSIKSATVNGAKHEHEHEHDETQRQILGGSIKSLTTFAAQYEHDEQQLQAPCSSIKSSTAFGATLALERFAHKLRLTKERHPLLSSQSTQPNQYTKKNRKGQTRQDKNAPVHYAISRYQLGPGQNVFSSIELMRKLPDNNNQRSIDKKNNDSCLTPTPNADLDTSTKISMNGNTNNTSTITRIKCSIRDDRKMRRHLAHFADDAFPCWSIFQEFPWAERYLEIDPKGHPSTWIQDLIKVYQRTNISVIPRGSSLPKRSRDNIGNTNQHGQQWCDWERPPQNYDPPMPIYHADGSASLPLKPYFHKGQHMEALQKVVLQSKFQRAEWPEVSTTDTDNTTTKAIIKVLLYDRKGSSRHWLYAEETKRVLEQEWNTKTDTTRITNHTPQTQTTKIVVQVLHDMAKYSLVEQAQVFHDADIIVTSHGAQLTNLAFIRPCTAVVELFPKGYYIGFFQAYVFAAGGISYEGYQYYHDKWTETKGTTTKELRKERRSGPILTSVESIVHAFPTIVLDVMSCRRGWNGFQNEY